MFQWKCSYFTGRCGPCQRIAPHFEMLPNKYPKAIFLKVDVDKCQDTASSQGVSAMPTFIFYRNRVGEIVCFVIAAINYTFFLDKN